MGTLNGTMQIKVLVYPEHSKPLLTVVVLVTTGYGLTRNQVDQTLQYNVLIYFLSLFAR